MNSKKSMNLFETRKVRVTSLSIGQFFSQIVNHFSELISCKINIRNILDVVELFRFLFKNVRAM